MSDGERGRTRETRAHQRHALPTSASISAAGALAPSSKRQEVAGHFYMVPCSTTARADRKPISRASRIFCRRAPLPPCSEEERQRGAPRAAHARALLHEHQNVVTTYPPRNARGISAAAAPACLFACICMSIARREKRREEKRGREREREKGGGSLLASSPSLVRANLYIYLLRAFYGGGEELQQHQFSLCCLMAPHTLTYICAPASVLMSNVCLYQCKPMFLFVIS